MTCHRTHPILLTFGVLASSCSSGDRASGAPAADTLISPGTVHAASTTVPNPLAAMAGIWDMRVLSRKGDSLAAYTLVATTDSSGWSMNFRGREPIPLHVIGSRGDSVMAEVGPYVSELRPGISVTTNFVGRIHNDSFIGSWVAHYRSKSADSVLRGRTEGVKAR